MKTAPPWSRFSSTFFFHCCYKQLFLTYNSILIYAIKFLHSLQDLSHQYPYWIHLYFLFHQVLWRQALYYLTLLQLSHGLNGSTWACSALYIFVSGDIKNFKA